jgi:serine/threonine protein kinase
MNYNILKELGRGGMATVFLAEHKLLKNKVAVKILNEEFVRNKNIRNRFLAEARNLATMSHTNIIKVTDLIDEGDTVAFVMEHVDGETLKEYLDRKGKLSDEEIRNVFSQMLDAVGYVHEQGLVHRDIKPSNFMIDKKGKVKLLDFGIAKNTDASSAEYTQTGTGMQMGTPMYMSPEQITETKSVTAQSDIYSLGVVLWQLVTGEKPYNTATLSNYQLQTKIVNESLSKTWSVFDVIIGKATEKETTKRYQNISEFSITMKTGNQTDASAVNKKTQINFDDKTVIENNEGNRFNNSNKKITKSKDSFPIEGSKELYEKHLTSFNKSMGVKILDQINEKKANNFINKTCRSIKTDDVDEEKLIQELLVMDKLAFYDSSFLGFGSEGFLICANNDEIYLLYLKNSIAFVLEFKAYKFEISNKGSLIFGRKNESYQYEIKFPLNIVKAIIGFHNELA